VAEQATSVGTLTQRMQNTSNGVGGLIPEFSLVPIDANGDMKTELGAVASPTNAATMDFANTNIPFSRFRIVYLNVTTPFAWVTSGQATIQLYASRATATVSTGATGAAPLIGSTSTLGAVGTSLASGLYIFSPQQLVELQWPYPWIGARLVFPSAPSAGAATLYFEVSSV
jgi:hypothetical protein